MGNLIVADDEYIGISSIYDEIGTVAEERLDKYFSVLKAITENAVSDGEVFKNLLAFIDEAQKIKGQISNLTKNAAEAFNAYISEIDKNDEYIY